MIDRRVLIGRATLGALAAPITAIAQPRMVQRSARIAVLSNNSPVAELIRPEPIDPNLRALVHGLRGLGWVEGRNIVIERRSAEGRPERVPAMVKEVVDLEVDVIVSYGIVITRAARQASTRIAIVSIGPNLVGLGFARQLAQPGGNITGLQLEAGAALDGKRLELLKAAVPKAARVAFIRPRPQAGRPLWAPETEAAARALGLTLTIGAVDTPEDIDSAFAAIERHRPDVMLCADSTLTFGYRQRIVEFAARQRLPAVYAQRVFAAAGGLMSYGADIVDLSRRAAGYVDKILNGAKPGELPIEQPTKFELVVNLKTARALGITLPQPLLLRADEVIE